MNSVGAGYERPIQPSLCYTFPLRDLPLRAPLPLHRFLSRLLTGLPVYVTALLRSTTFSVRSAPFTAPAPLTCSRVDSQLTKVMQRKLLSNFRTFVT